MRARIPAGHNHLPANFIASLVLAAGFAGFVAWDQSHWWRAKEDYSFGWLVPFFAAFVVYDRWPRIRAALGGAAEMGVQPRWVRWVLNGVATLGLVAGALFFLLGAFYRAGAGASHPGTLALTLGMAAIVLPLIFFNVPTAGVAAIPGRWEVTRIRHDPRLHVALLFLFPVLVWLISAPLVSVVESRISLFLLRKVVTAVAFCFEMLGYPVEQHGNVLMLPKGAVGVADACSGIRSLTACLFAGSFLGAVFLREFWKKVVLVIAAMGFAFLMNLGRSLFLTAWAYANGPAAISGSVHDAAGYAVLGLTCAGLVALLPLLNLKFDAGPELGQA